MPIRQRIARRYHADEVLPRLFRRERPGGRLLVLEGQPHTRTSRSCCPSSAASPAPREPGTWGYSRCASPEQFARAVCDAAADRPIPRAARRLLLHAVRRHLSGGQRACCMPTGGRSFRSSRSPRRPAVTVVASIRLHPTRPTPGRTLRPPRLVHGRGEAAANERANGCHTGRERPRSWRCGR